MNILVVDEDERQVPELCHLLKLLGHEITQITDWRRVPDIAAKKRYDFIILDLMMPIWDANPADCFGGYGTGVYVYKSIIHPTSQGIPFAVLSGVDQELSVSKKMIAELKQFDEFRGAFSKEEVEKLLKEIPNRHT